VAGFAFADGTEAVGAPEEATGAVPTGRPGPAKLSSGLPQQLPILRDSRWWVGARGPEEERGRFVGGRGRFLIWG